MTTRLLIDSDGNMSRGKMSGGPSFDRRAESEEDEDSDNAKEDPISRVSEVQDIPRKSTDNIIELQRRVEKLEEMVEMLKQRIEDIQGEKREIPRSEMEKTTKYKLYLDDEICGELEVGTEAVFDLRISKKGNVRICKMGEDGSHRIPVGSKIILEIEKENVEGLFLEEKNQIYLSLPVMKKYPFTIKFAI